jgi:dipeptidyl aminopeptidase/acylaminoacyl peptidase
VLDGRNGKEQHFSTFKKDGGWVVLEKASAFSKTNPLSGLGVNSARSRAYGFALHEGRNALWEFDLEDAKAPAVVFAHPRVDVSDVAVDSLGQVIGVQYTTDRPQVEYADERLLAVMRGINKALPDTFNYIRSTTADRKKWIIASRGDTEGGRFQLYDAESRKLAGIGSQYPKLGAQQLARMRAMEYPAQDGTKIPGYLTTPSDGRTEKLPLVVMPHSGYQGRADWAYDMMTQFLASRGYAVITMNFRGSSGYGKAWLEAGEEDWGGIIYSDITDAARWAIAQGIADPQRICVVGRGPSAYAALQGAIRNPDIYKCAASIGGRTDLIDYAKHMRTIAPNSKSAAAEKNTEKKENKEDSPLRRAADVKIPILLIHGTHDTKTPFAQSEDMAKALAKAGKQHRLVIVERADSTFWREAERATMLKTVEDFLAANLGT